MKVRKRPIVIDAVQFVDNNYNEVRELTGEKYFRPVFDGEFEQEAEIVAAVWDKLHSTWVGVKTGQWIMKGTEGEHWPVDNTVFVKSYEFVDPTP